LKKNFAGKLRSRIFLSGKTFAPGIFWAGAASRTGQGMPCHTGLNTQKSKKIK